MRFVRFSYYKTANCTAPCGAVHCYLRCGYAILWAVLVRFLRFVWFGEHPSTHFLSSRPSFFYFFFLRRFYIHTINHFYFSPLLFHLFLLLHFIFFLFLYFIHFKLSLSLSLSLQNINSTCICILNLVSCCTAMTPPFCLYF